ncbi:hypothetical protein E3Q09_04211 [Wallemia mellicola]|nr:hypothetical protein E3Q09_04211 [Wallemia mellicola]
MSVNQATRLERADKQDDRNNPENDQTPTDNLILRINIKFCSYCLENHDKSPHTHTDNDCGHLHPELKDKYMNKRHLTNSEETRPNIKPQLSSTNYGTSMTRRFPSDVALFDQGSDVTYTCRLDLLTNVRRLNTPERFGTINGETKSSLNDTINWIEKEANYSSHYASTILSKKLLEKYKLSIYYKLHTVQHFHNKQ